MTNIVQPMYLGNGLEGTIVRCNRLTRAKEDHMVGNMTRDPMLDLLHQLEHRMGRTFNGELLRASEWPVPEAATTAWLPLVDIFEEPDVIRLVAEVPGVRPEDV